ncbi:MAG TPA: DUF2147 domain-containing protein [Ideonella sp.]|uniref:DUF2147 domain-containing protein n=1 Tax=Ideonella sp. TaxID=1929293 RepID=UPI002C665C17|nr:DUF2147 domain-containing protein [Ideonella sp.]HSI50622.1 DUF2147 domain-containing protein [Ideonella sp.]
MPKMLCWVPCVLLSALAGASCRAAGPEEAQGLWMTAEKDAVIEFKPCAEPAGALCGRIVWDKDAGTPADTCGVLIAQLARYDNEAWRDGWVYDPRDKKKYKGAVRVKSGDLAIRAFVGVEVLGQTELLKRVAALPAAPVCKP